jgi:FkbH-like protein
MDLSQLRQELSGLGFNDYLRHLKPVAEQVVDGKPLRVAIVRSYTVEPIEPVLKLRLLLDGYLPTVWFGGYDQYVQELLDQQSALYPFRPDVVLMMVRIEEVLPAFVDAFPSRPPAEWEELLVAKARELAALAERAVRTSSAQVFIQSLTLARGSFGVFDAQEPNGQAQLVQTFNRALTAAVSQVRGAFVWDFDGFVRTKGLDNLLDPKQWYVARNPYRQSEYPAIGSDLYRHVRSALGRVAKCIVLDLDNTLWGGIVGEDGFDGIKLGHTYPGNCYRDFQKELLKLYDRGILLAINSKNNEDDALRIIDEHPDMVLRRHHFAARRINWNDKASNLRAIAKELNIGVDSLIFVDDNPVECELIRQQCPECDVVLLPDKPYLLPAGPSSWGRVENIRLTAEDRQRGEMYRAQNARREHEAQYTNLDDFLRTLGMAVNIDEATAFSTPRIAQLTQKTNQLNMTTRRYSESQITAFANNPNATVLSVSASDRFGDHGIVGVMILEYQREACRIDTFLLSCRVIGRGVEQTMVACAADLARARGLAVLEGEFIPTAKNQPAAGIYERTGFSRVSDSETLFRADLRDASIAYPAHTKVSRPVHAVQSGAER